MKPMQLAIIHNGQVFPVIDSEDGDIREYDLDKPLARAGICNWIKKTIKKAEQEMGK